MPSTYVRLMARAIPDTARLLAGTGLTPAVLTKEGPITVAQQLTCIRNSMAMMQRPDWHLAWSRRVGERFHGPISRAQLSAPTLGDGIDVFARFMSQRVPYLAWREHPGVDEYRLSVTPRMALEELAPILVEIPLFSLACYVRTFQPDYPGSLRLEFEHAPLVAPVVYRQWFDFDFRFGARRNAVSLPTRWRRLVNINCDPALWQAALRQCTLTHHQAGIRGDVETLVINVLHGSLGSGSPVNRAPTLAEAAARLDTSPRTLSRRLTAAGTSYGALLERVRKMLADDMLDASRAVGEVADALGYASVASFDRAYRRWHGRAPRRQLVAGRRESCAALGDHLAS
ncbi:MAG: AraC family transcriptional regulator ligand-binding domain-containing protein [Gammaproteobacteria bacterium]|nr:AraC family transcriptional regulator ligand-binding domain-containing protein [Gammaproteobacteria bacterium]